MPGVLTNVAAILVGGGVGLLLGQKVNVRFQKTMTQGLALCILLIGLSGALDGTDTIGAIVCMVLGAIIGEALDIERRLDGLGEWVQRRMKGHGSNVSQGFVTASLLFCVGAMAVVGSLDAGLSGKYDTLFAKSILDGVSALLFATTLGVGVLFSAVPILIYQGAIALLAGLMQPLLSDAVVALMSGTGGLLIAGLGLNMLGIEKIKVGNLLP
ncbi:MAG: DUF554 domain-containing protein, partial [Candidatus Fimadaptatus sp.]